MSNLFWILASVLATMAVVFLGFAYIQWQIDPTCWTFETRSFSMIAMALTGLIAAGITADGL